VHFILKKRHFSKRPSPAMPQVSKPADRPNVARAMFAAGTPVLAMAAHHPDHHPSAPL
jgi:hypothetical protein